MSSSPSIRSMLVVAVVSLATFGCAQTSSITQQAASSPQPSIANIQSHMSFLADDLLEGRDTGTRGHEIASLYIAGEFKKFGLTPAGDNDTFMQRVGFRRALLVQESPEFVINTDAGEHSFNYPKDFIMGADPVRTSAELSAPMVFVGYGIIAEEFGHNDYAGLDVEGKIVVALSGRPSGLNSEEGTHLASSAQKSKYAVDNGAVGYITLQTPAGEKRRPYERSLTSIHAPRLRWVDPQGNVGNTFPQLEVRAFVNMDTAAVLFENAPVSAADIYAQIEADEVPTGFALPATARLKSASTHDEFTSPNVAGVLPGSDPDLKDEYIVFTAHSDHLGISKSVELDRINNGALDNASGTSVLIETARMFASLPKAPARSIMFLAVTGEERGLLGADYFVKNPTVPKESLVANVNLDMPLLTYESSDVIAFGASHSSMGGYVESAVANAGITLTDDPWPELNLFTRSDHYAFVREGIPAVFLVTGIKSKDPEIDGSQVLNTFLATHYHRPSDDMNQDFNWNAARTFTQVNFEIGQTLADAPQRPVWNEDSFFGNTFGRK